MGGGPGTSPRGHRLLLVIPKVDELSDESQQAYQTGEEFPLADWLALVGQGGTSFLPNGGATTATLLCAKQRWGTTLEL